MTNIEKPASGIMKTSNWDESSVCYHIECSCTDPDHAVQAWIEIDMDADIAQPQLTFYVQTTYSGWKGFVDRVKDAIHILVGGKLVRYHSLLLEKQAALNVAAALNETIEDLANTQLKK